MKSSDLKVATHADIANIRYCFFCQPGGVSRTLAVRTNWLNVHTRIMYTIDLVLLAAIEQFEDQATSRLLIALLEEYEDSGTTQKELGC